MQVETSEYNGFNFSKGVSSLSLKTYSAVVSDRFNSHKYIRSFDIMDGDTKVGELNVFRPPMVDLGNVDWPLDYCPSENTLIAHVYGTTRTYDISSGYDFADGKCGYVGLPACEVEPALAPYDPFDL